MYRIINENIDSILTNEKNNESHFRKYNTLNNMIKNFDVSKNIDFQKKYKSFYAMGRMNEEYYKKYFELLEKNKSNKNIELEYVINELYKVSGSIHFSFASKMVHTINNDKPIYDSKVSNFYILPNWNNKNFNVRLEKIKNIYESLIKEYSRIYKKQLLESSIEKVKEVYKLQDTIEYNKIIDSIIWMFINYKEKNVGKILYK